MPVIQCPPEGRGFLDRFLNTPRGKKIESFWALLHNSFTQTFSSARSPVRNAQGCHLSYMEEFPVLHPTVGCISFKRLMHPMMLKSQRVPTPFLVQHFMFRTGKGDEHFLLNPTEISVSLGHTYTPQG